MLQNGQQLELRELSESCFDLEAGPQTVHELDTPIPIIDLDVVERNILGWQGRCTGLGLHNRPHVKTHKLIPLARLQVDVGAIGITVQKLGEAEVMANAGLRDILITFNIVGNSKLGRLAELARRVRISVVADSETVAKGISRAGQSAGTAIGVLVECDTGGARCGVQSPEEALKLATRIDALPGVRFLGLLTYPAKGTRSRMSAFLAGARELIQQQGLDLGTISVGGTPDILLDEGLSIATEYRAGTYIYNDRSLVLSGVCSESDCALDVLATVVSCPVKGRAILDAGSKSLTSDGISARGFGMARGSGEVVYGLSEEHGMLDIASSDGNLKVGSRVRIIPNHACPVSNLFERVAIVRGERVLGYATVDARGMVT